MTPTREHQSQIESPVPVGTLVDGYRVRRIISVRGGLHTLAEATSLSGERVTLKLMAEPPESKELRRRAAKLARVRGSIHHPNMLPVLGDRKRRTHLCLKSTPPNAATLADRLAEGRLAPELAVTLLSQVAGALETALGQGLVHRELTPDAVIVTEDGARALLTDFGTGVPDTPGCELYAAVEDADYRSPEEIRGEPPLPESNVYALACILVACLTGASPYPYDRPLLALYAHLTATPPRPSERNADLPRELDAVIAKAMSKDPRERHRSPGVFMRAAQQALGVGAIIPVPAAAPERQEAGGSRKQARIAKKQARVARKQAPAARIPGPGKAPSRPRPARAPSKPRPAKPPSTPQPAAQPSMPQPAAERSDTSGHGRRTHRQAQPERSPRGRGRLTARRLAPTWIGIALLASALAGFATGNRKADGSGQPAAVAPAPPAAAPDTAASAPTVGPLVKRLDDQRAAARDRLRTARQPAIQAAVAWQLATVYRDARSALLQARGPVSFQSSLAQRLAAVELAYRRLAAAAQQRSSGAWQLASREVVDRERDFEVLLRTHRWT